MSNDTHPTTVIILDSEQLCTLIEAITLLQEHTMHLPGLSTELKVEIVYTAQVTKTGLETALHDLYSPARSPGPRQHGLPHNYPVPPVNVRQLDPEAT